MQHKANYFICQDIASLEFDRLNNLAEFYSISLYKI